MLSRIDFICVDMGSEKGDLNENTTPEVVNFCLIMGFIYLDLMKTELLDYLKITSLFRYLLSYNQYDESIYNWYYGARRIIFI